MTPEGLVKNQICSWLASKHTFFFIHDSVGIYDPTRQAFRANKSPYRIKGVADILGIYKGRFLAIEVKVKGKYPTREQKAFLERVNAEGGIGFVARSIEDVVAKLTTPHSLVKALEPSRT
jgi:hypothetical protein